MEVEIITTIIFQIEGELTLVTTAVDSWIWNKVLQELPESQRADAVSSMVYEGNARLRDPVYGCAGAIFQLQKQVNELQAQLAKAQAEVVTMQCQQANLMSLICMEMEQSPQSSPDQQSFDNNSSTNLSFLDDNNPESLWESPLWT